MSVTELLAEYGIDNDDDTFTDALADTLRQVPDPAAAPLTEAAMAYLADHGGTIARDTVDHYQPAATRTAQLAAAVAATVTEHTQMLSRAELAAQLRVAPTRVSHLAAAGKVWADRHGRYPHWQVYQGRLLPGLSEVAAAIPEDVNPLDVADLMAAPQDELGRRTPIQHLAAGGDPAKVAELLTAMPWW